MIQASKHTISTINRLSPDQAVELLGELFEHSPWIVAESWAKAPFASVTTLHAALCNTVRSASEDAQVALIRSHPDLVGRAALAGTLTSASRTEQRAAGLATDDLTADEIDAFTSYNARYQQKFGFPFVICARGNRKASILAGVEDRLTNGPATERNTAIREIERIAWYRLTDLVEDDSPTAK